MSGVGSSCLRKVLDNKNYFCACNKCDKRKLDEKPRKKLLVKNGLDTNTGGDRDELRSMGLQG